jgi:hypothetical protein
MARDKAWELAGPDEAALAEMAKHCNRKHLAALDRNLHVSYANHRRHEARVIYLPGGEGRGGEKFASFECLLCDPPQRFLLGLIEFSSPGSRQRWLRENPALADEIATSEIPEELVGPAIEAYVHGEIRAGDFAEWLREQRRRKLARRRPKDAAREDGCMRFLLERRLEGKTVEGAIEALLRLQADDPDAWQALSGGTRTVTEPTLQRYWRHIPGIVRKAVEAAAAGEGSVAPEVKERLLSMLSPSNELPQAPEAGQARRRAKRPLLPLPGALKDRGGPRARGER